MQTAIAIASFFGAYYLIDNLPTAWAIPVGLLTIAGLFAGAIALAVKWVRNV